MNEARRRALLLLALLPLTACGSVLPGQRPPATLYRPTPKNTFPADLPKVNWQLVIAEPEADASLDTTRIALMREPTLVEYYARANWTDRAPAMVQTLLLESFENSGAIEAVGRRALGLRADFELKTELRDFQAEYVDGTRSVRVTLNAKLIQLPRRAIVGSQTFSATAPMAEDSLPSMVTAIDEALGKTMKQIVTWTLGTGQARYQPAT